MRDDAADVCHLRDTNRILSQVFPDELVGRFPVTLAGHLQLEIAGVEFEQVLQQFLIRHVRAVDGVDVATRADMDPDVLALLGGKSFENAIIEFNKVG